MKANPQNLKIPTAQKLLPNQFFPDIRFFRAYHQGNTSILYNPPWEKQFLYNRTYILDHGRLVRLSVPVHIQEHGIVPDFTQDWLRVHLGAIKAAYGKTGYFEFLFPYVEKILSCAQCQIWEINKEFVELALKVVRLPKPQWVNQSQVANEDQVLRWPDDLKSVVADNFSDLQQDNLLADNLSIVHMLFHHGPAAINFLQPHSVI